MSLEETHKITVDWKIEGIKELLEKAEKEDVLLDSASFAENRWYVGFRMYLADKDECGIYLYARPHDEDRLNSSSTKSWSRPALQFTLTIYDTKMSLVKTYTTVTPDISSANPSWGWKAFATRDQLRQAISDEDALVVRCEFTPATATRPGLADSSSRFAYTTSLLNSQSCSDVLFTIRPTSAYILASKAVLVKRSAYFRDLLSSDFCESTEVTVDPEKLAFEPSSPLKGDCEDFRMFESVLGIEIAQEIEGQATDEDDLVQVEGAESSSTSSPAQESSASQSARYFAKVTISDCSYSTYYALLFFLYTGRVSFLPPMSDYLIAFQDETRNPPNAPYSVEARDAWLFRRAPNKDPPPCNPRALYRLADRYLMEDLKKLAQGYIIRSLTVENVAYEIFCTLSKDYETHRDEVLKFLLENWDAVKKTRAWSQSMELLEEGNLPGGTAVLSKIFEALVVKK